MTSQDPGHAERNRAQPGASPLADRDRTVVELVGQFGQLTAGQIGVVLFADRASQTPLDRTLKRLIERKYLVRLARPVGGHGGGSAQYVYQLGRAGWRLLERPGEYWAPRSVNLHTLAIADCLVGLKRAEQTGALELITFITEPACHQSVGHLLLTPDAYFEAGLRRQRLKCAYFLEVDRGTEHANVLRDKCQSYWQGFQLWQREYFPRVMFVAPDDRRRRLIERVVTAGPDQAQDLFRVCTMTSFPQALTYSA